MNSSYLHTNSRSTTQAIAINPVEYEPNCPFPFDNFIYHVIIKIPTTSEKTIKSSKLDVRLPGTSPLPAGTTSIILRLTNPHPGTGLNSTNRVENEVAFLTLVREALAESKFSHIVPDLYTWASMRSGQGFTMLQYMPGTIPDEEFEDMSFGDQKIVLGQMAEILSTMQKFRLPPTVKSIGGLTFDEDGGIISGQMTLWKGGPFESYVGFVRAIFADKLAEADNNPVIDGWRENEVRPRLDAYIDSGLEEILKDVKDTRKVLVHADLSKSQIYCLLCIALSPAYFKLVHFIIDI